MLRSSLKFLTILVLACSIGLHWSFLQSVAWTSMLVSNLSTGSFSQAVERTFDGKHPCCLCKAVAEGKKSEKRADTILQLKKFDALSQSITICLVCPASFPPATRVGQLMRLLLYPPPTPPPLAV